MSFCAALALTLHLVSWHTDPGFENGNYGLGLECAVDENATLSAGAYRNSFGRTSAYAMVGIETAGKLRTGVAVGVATNYPDGTIAMGGFTLAYDFGPATARVLFAPAAMGKSGFAHLTMSVPL